MRGCHWRHLQCRLSHWSSWQVRGGGGRALGSRCGGWGPLAAFAVPHLEPFQRESWWVGVTGRGRPEELVQEGIVGGGGQFEHGVVVGAFVASSLAQASKVHRRQGSFSTLCPTYCLPPPPLPHPLPASIPASPVALCMSQARVSSRPSSTSLGWQLLMRLHMHGGR